MVWYGLVAICSPKEATGPPPTPVHATGGREITGYDFQDKLSA